MARPASGGIGAAAIQPRISLEASASASPPPASASSIRRRIGAARPAASSVRANASVVTTKNFGTGWPRRESASRLAALPPRIGSSE
jgi:hypothetical protein